MQASSQRIAGSYVEFAPIIAGSILACAISAVLFQFGGALGLSASRIDYEAEYLSWRVIAIGLWLFWVQLIASMSGGYIAGRLREPVAGANPHEVEMRDGMHGLLVWATSTVLMVIAVAIGTFLTTIAASYGVEAENRAMASDALARRSGIILGFALSASSIVSAIAAWWTGTLGGDHRDGALDLSKMFSFRKKQ
jgi:hypothetical protein